MFKFSENQKTQNFLATGRLRNPKGRLMEGARPLLANVALLFFFHWEYKHPFLLNLPVHQIIRPFMMQTYISIKFISNSHMYPFITQKSLKYRMISIFLFRESAPPPVCQPHARNFEKTVLGPRGLKL